MNKNLLIITANMSQIVKEETVTSPITESSNNVPVTNLELDNNDKDDTMDHNIVSLVPCLSNIVMYIN